MKEDTLDRLNKLSEACTRAASVIRQETDEIVAAEDHIALIRHFVDLRTANEMVKAAKTALIDIEDYLSKSAIPDLVRKVKEEKGVKPPFHIEGIGTVSVAYKYSCSMLDKDKGLEWLRSNGHGGLIIETVPSPTLSTFAKELVEVQGKDMPADIFKTGAMPYTSVRKGK